MYVVIWEFRVSPSHRDAFEQAYGPKGEWAQFFRQYGEYRGTQLLYDGKRYMTVDSWSNKSAYDAFRSRHAQQYSAIDARCEAYTVGETLIGAFETLEPFETRA